MQSWAQEELKDANLPDINQDRREFSLFTHHPRKTWNKGFGMTLRTKICQRVKSPFHHDIDYSRSPFGNFRSANMDSKSQNKEEEKEPEGQLNYSEQGK